LAATSIHADNIENPSRYSLKHAHSFNLLRKLSDVQAQSSVMESDSGRAICEDHHITIQLLDELYEEMEETFCKSRLYSSNHQGRHPSLSI
jgi:hypothetical protein